MNTIEWTPKALRQLRKINNLSAQKSIYLEVQNLAHFPECQNVIKLTNHKYHFRLRAGNYRIFFNHDGTIRIVVIQEVKKRDEHTY